MSSTRHCPGARSPAQVIATRRSQNAPPGRLRRPLPKRPRHLISQCGLIPFTVPRRGSPRRSRAPLRGRTAASPPRWPQVRGDDADHGGHLAARERHEAEQRDSPPRGTGWRGRRARPRPSSRAGGGSAGCATRARASAGRARRRARSAARPRTTRSGTSPRPAWKTRSSAAKVRRSKTELTSPKTTM